MNIHLLWRCGCLEFVFIALAAILNFAASKSVFRGLEPRNLWIVFWPLTKLSTWVYHTRKEIFFLKINIAHFIDAWKVVFIWRPFWISRSAGVRPGTHYWGWVFGRSDCFPSRYKRLRRFLVSYLTPVDRWIQNEHEYSGQIFPNVPDLRYSSLLPSPDHLCQPEAHRFWKHKILLFHLLCI